MDPLILTAVAALVAGGVGWVLGNGAGKRATPAVSTAPKPTSVPQPATTSVDEEALKQAALWEALHRVSKHLASSVEAPLLEAAKGDYEELRDGVGEALGALEDIDFFLQTPPEGLSEIDLGEAVSEVVRDFRSESGGRPKQRGPRRPIQVTGNPDALKDALFLILHNATQFGGDKPIDVVVRVQDGHGRVHVRDRGRGFSAEALSRAYDPFYTTVEGNPGLGLAHARKLIEDAGGKIHLRNSERGGGEVEIGLPLTS